MTFYEIIIRPISGFGTPLKGDTLFGQFCWQVVYQPNLVHGGLQHALEQYLTKPFAVFSSAFPKLPGQKGYAFKRPDMPSSWLFPKQKNRKTAYLDNKEKKKSKWVRVDQSLTIHIKDLLSDSDIIGKTNTSMMTHYRQNHNKINRLTNSTGSGQFAPFITENFFYYPHIELAIFVCIDTDQTDIDSICLGLANMGHFGFGKDASTGMGRFTIINRIEHAWPMIAHANACYTLAPSVPESEHVYKSLCFSPFVRFGKHGDELVKTGSPFKNPVIMADEGAVFFPNSQSIFNQPYIGQGIKGHSKAPFAIYTQGYAPYLPIKLEKANA